MDTVLSTLEKVLAARSGEMMIRQQSRCIPKLYSEPLLMSRRSVIDAEILVGLARETKAADGCNTSSLNHDRFVLVWHGSCIRSMVLSATPLVRCWT